MGIPTIQRRKIQTPDVPIQNITKTRVPEQNVNPRNPSIPNLQMENPRIAPLTSIHPIFQERPHRSPNTMQGSFNPQFSFQRQPMNMWAQPRAPNANVYQMEMLQSIFEKTEADNVYTEKFSLSLPEKIQQEIAQATSKGFKIKRIDIGEVNVQVFILQNKIWMWNYQNEYIGSLTFEVHVKKVQLLKIMGNLLFMWVELENQTANVVQVAEAQQEDEEDLKELLLTPLLLKQKSLFALTSKWVDYINGIIFVDISKNVGTLVFEEEYARINIRLHSNPGTINSGKLKRVKKAITNVFSWKKFYDFKIRIFEEGVYILKTSFNSNKNGKIVELEDALHSDSNNLPSNPVKVRSQAIYKYYMTPRGRLICRGKLSLKKLFRANKMVLDSHFQASGGFDTSLRIVDIQIKDLPKAELLEKSIQNPSPIFNFLGVTKELGEELRKLTNSHNVLESSLVGISLVLLLENGVEIEVFPHEGLIKRIETLIILQEENATFSYLGYLEEGEVILKKKQDLFLMTR